MKRHASQTSSNDANVQKVALPIATNGELNAIVTQYQNAEFLAVYTEFLRERTYYPQLCLIQISDGVDAVAIDPLAPKFNEILFVRPPSIAITIKRKCRSATNGLHVGVLVSDTKLHFIKCAMRRHGCSNTLIAKADDPYKH